MIFLGNSVSFQAIREEIRMRFAAAPLVQTERWQGVAANQDTRELRNVCFEVYLKGVEDLDHWREDIQPNLPWADRHFEDERVGGQPLNPGEQWKNWPYANSASKFKTERFNHSYMERLWPKYARRTTGGTLAKGKALRKYPLTDPRPLQGIGHSYGDLQDLVELLAKEPYTRQAYIPLFFPEDTGLGDSGRKPCTLGYQIIVRDSEAHIWYPLRSCDYVRHWADDCYMAVRLLLWVMEECRQRNSDWKQISCGTFSMHMTSLHIFSTDRLNDEIDRATTRSAD
jgi:thymidylate synthase